MESRTVFTVNKDDVLLGLLAVFLPPVSVALRKGFWTKELLISFILTGLYGFPGILYAFYVIYISSNERSRYNSLSGGPDLEAQNSDVSDASSQKNAVAGGELPPNYEEIHDNQIPADSMMDQKTQH